MAYYSFQKEKMIIVKSLNLGQSLLRLMQSIIFFFDNSGYASNEKFLWPSDWSNDYQLYDQINEVTFQILMNVLQKRTTAVLMLCVTTPKDRTPVHANLDILEMDGLAKVIALSVE